MHSSSNIVRTTHAHWSLNYGLYPSHADALQVLTVLGVVASVCTPLPTRTQQLTTLLAQQCWELFRSFAGSLTFLNVNLCENKGYLFESRNLVKHMSREESKRLNLYTFLRIQILGLQYVTTESGKNLNVSNNNNYSVNYPRQYL